jgi:hypothetical protein
VDQKKAGVNWKKKYGLKIIFFFFRFSKKSTGIFTSLTGLQKNCAKVGNIHTLSENI